MPANTSTSMTESIGYSPLYIPATTCYVLTIRATALYIHTVQQANGCISLLANLHRIQSFVRTYILNNKKDDWYLPCHLFLSVI